LNLRNKYNKKDLRDQLNSREGERTVLSFYKYANIGNPNFFRDYLYYNWEQIGVLGRIYVANEGINAQISVPSENFETFKNLTEDIIFLRGNRLNIAVEHEKESFIKLKIKVRPKIVADGLNDKSFDVTNGGKHLSAEQFNQLANDDETVIVDMRNHYESEVGHFTGAITPDVDTFRESLPLIEDILKGKEQNNIIMYCTGGIRCEKASAYFKHKGFENVHQLDGGIIKYAKDAKEQGLENKFKGKNFVFDYRLGEKISDDVISVCHQCGTSCDTHINCVNEACHLLLIQCKSCKAKYNSCCSDECKEIYALPIEEQRALRKGKGAERNVFKKGRSNNLTFKK